MKILSMLASAALSCGVATGAVAQEGYPSKPIRLLIPYAAGGTTDIMARALQQPMSETLGQPVIVDNKAGAAGTIAMKDAARSAPDGYTLVFINNGLVATTPVLQKDAGYDGIRDFTPVGMVATSPMVVVINGDVPATDLRSFIEYARRSERKVDYASAGPGSFGHLSTELFARAAGVDMVHVPYKGQAPTVNAVLSGEVKLLITSPSAAMNAHITAGKLKLLGVGTTENWPLTPGVPTVSSVLKGFNAESWFAVLAPAGTPQAVVNRLNSALNAALAQPDIRKRFNGFGLEAVSSTPAQLKDRVAVEVKRWGDVIGKAGIRVE